MKNHLTKYFKSYICIVIAIVFVFLLNLYDAPMFVIVWNFCVIVCLGIFLTVLENKRKIPDEKIRNDCLNTFYFCSFFEVFHHRNICTIKLYNDRLKLYSFLWLKLTLFYKDIVDVEKSLLSIVIFTSKDEYKISVWNSKKFLNKLKSYIK